MNDKVWLFIGSRDWTHIDADSVEAALDANRKAGININPATVMFEDERGKSQVVSASQFLKMRKRLRLKFWWTRD